MKGSILAARLPALHLGRCHQVHIVLSAFEGRVLSSPRACAWGRVMPPVLGGHTPTVMVLGGGPPWCVSVIAQAVVNCAATPSLVLIASGRVEAVDP